jgi:acyl-coenzyme A synthetase/AMP-(fatty) acid ligase/thioesterase domain-containing protein/acyl carrier protein
MLGDSGAIVIVTNSASLTAAYGLAGEEHQVINLDEIADDLSEDNLCLPIASSSLAYILYTSGSTGNPKGVVQSHRNVLHNTMRHTNAYCICSDDRQSLLYTSSVYGGQRDMYNALLNGASLHIYSVKVDGIFGLADWIINNEISIYCSVATIFRQFSETLTGCESFDSVRLIKLGGEATYKREVDAYKKYFSPDCIMHCGLGSTETGMVRSFYINKSTPINGNTVPLGYPVDDMEVLLLDEVGKPVIAGNIGEIAIKSRYIALGYWRNPELTQKVFKVDPEDGDVRTYFTGDLGIIHPDGCLEHRGRKDFQIKIRGNRVEVSEVEMALLAQGTIKDVVIVGWKDPQGIDKLVAYLVSGETKPSIAALQQALAAKLPEFMVPSYFVWLDTLPLLPNGKLDRKALPTPGNDRTSLGHEYTEPSTPLERRLIEIWSSLLGVSKIGIHDPFFELGGDSLSAVMMFAALDKELGVSLPTSTLAEHPTIHKLAYILSDRENCIEWPVLVPVKKTGDKPPLFCVHGIFGDQFFLRSLGAHLNSDRPLYAFQSPRLDGRYFRHKTIDALARDYLQELRTIQPHGPYYLSGYSFGGLIALEMARQLTANHEAVAYLAIFDSNPPALSDTKPIGRMQRIISIPSEVLDFSAKALLTRKKLGVRTRLTVMVKAMQSATKYIKGKLQHLYLRFGFRLPVMKRDEYIAWNHYRLCCTYHPDRYSGVIDIFYTGKKEARITAGWRNVISGQTSFYPVPGEHHDFFKEPHVVVFAEQINNHLA